MAEISEKELEDFIVGISDGQPGAEHDELFIEGRCFRQVNLDGYGIADLIFIHFDAIDRDLSVEIVELKKGVIDMKAVGQVCRYRVGVERFISKIIERHSHFRRASYQVSCCLIGNGYAQDDTRYVVDCLDGVNTYIYGIDLARGISFKHSDGWYNTGENHKHLSAIFRELKPIYRDYLAAYYKYELGV